jgi:hypothetical protein
MPLLIYIFLSASVMDNLILNWNIIDINRRSYKSIEYTVKITINSEAVIR